MAQRKVQHQRALASVGNAASLFGGGSADDADFFNALGGSTHPQAGAPPPPQRSPAGSQGISTVVEEEEPVSPEVELRGSEFAPQIFGAGTSTQDDWLSGGEHQPEPHQQYDAALQAEQAPGQAYGAATAYDYSQQPSYDTSTSHHDHSQHDYSTQSTSHDQNPSESYDPNAGYVEPQVYPGYIYDYASNSYLPDPSAQAEGWTPDQQSVGYQANGSEEDAQGQWSGYTGDGGYQPQGAQYGEQQWDQEGHAAGGQHSWKQQEAPQEQQQEEYPSYAPYPALPSSPDQGHDRPQAYQSFAQLPEPAYDPYDPYAQQQAEQSYQQHDMADPYASSYHPQVASSPRPASAVAPPPPASYQPPQTFSPPPRTLSTGTTHAAVPPPPRTAKSAAPPPRSTSSPSVQPAYTTSPPSPPPATFTPPTEVDAFQPYPSASSESQQSSRAAPAPTSRSTSEQHSRHDSPPIPPSHSVTSWEQSTDAPAAFDGVPRSPSSSEEFPVTSTSNSHAWDADLSSPSPSYASHEPVTSEPHSWGVDLSSRTIDTDVDDLVEGLHDSTLDDHPAPRREDSWSSNVPELSVEAPSPEMEARYDEQPGEPQAGIEAEMGGAALADLFPTQSAASTGDEQYGFDDSQVFGVEGGNGGSLAGSNYGEWSGKSEAMQGYDYAAGADGASGQAYGSYAQEAEKSKAFAPTVNALSDAESSYDYAPSTNESPYAPPDSYAYAPSTTDSPYSQPTPPPHVTTPDTYGSQKYGSPTQYGSYESPPMPTSYPSSSKPSGLRLQPRQADSSQDPYAAYPTTPTTPFHTDSNDSYANYPTPTNQSLAAHDAYSATADGNMTAPAAYGSYPESTPYSPYGPPPTNARRYSFDEPAAAPYDPYARPEPTRQMSSASADMGEAADLGLERCMAPVISFGFGGRMLVVFPGSSTLAYGMDAYGAAPTAPSSPSTVHIRKVVDLFPCTVAEASYPGPIFMDGGRANAGKKRKEAVSWLEGRIGELEQEAAYVRDAGPAGFGMAGSEDEGVRKRKLETRVILVKLVKTLVENEGKLSGTPKIDETVRSILVPHTAAAADSSDADLPLASELAFAHPITPMATGSSDAPLATYMVTPSNLDRISAFLLRGERRKAVKYALDHQMWAHAFVISSCVDTDCWKDVVTEFLRSELSPSLDGGSATSNGREGLRVAYSMFAGLGGESIQQFLPPRPLAQPQSYRTAELLSAGPIPRAATPISPSFPDAVLVGDLPKSVLANWQETVAMIIANRTAGDSAALTALGDTLMTNGWLDAAHVCYLLSPGTSPIGGVGTPSTRLVLVGGEALTASSMASVTLESIMLTELVEFAFSLAPAVKGQEQFPGFPHLQAFRLFHATQLADAGHVSQAQKYTDAIVNTLKLATKSTPFYNPGLVAQVKVLSDRLIAAPGHDKGGSWLALKVPRPTIDSLWSTLEGRFSKFVAGEGEPAASQVAKAAEVAKLANGGAIGPFSHYSSISPGNTSGTLSQHHSQTDVFAQNAYAGPPSRPTSAAAQPVVGPPPVKRAPFKTHHSRSSSLGFAGYNYDAAAPPPWQSYQPPEVGHDADATTPKATSHEFGADREYGYESTAYDDVGDAEERGNGNDRGWGWEARSDSLAASSSSLRAPAFTPVNETFAEDESGFISPMAAYTPSASPGIPSSSYSNQQQMSHKRTTTRDELDDLGIGNSKSCKPTFDAIDEQAGEGEDGTGASEKRQDAKKVGDKPAIKPSRSWLGGWFKREASPAAGAGPVRANLGEQTSFVYDAELKRWVNKKSGGDSSSAPPTNAPPPRAATASPTRAARAHMPPPRYMSETPPPLPSGPPCSLSGLPPPPLNRAKTSADLNEMTRSSAGQFRSASTGPSPMPPRPSSAAGSSGPPSGAGTPVGGRRKPISKRYVAIS